MNNFGGGGGQRFWGDDKQGQQPIHAGKDGTGDYAGVSLGGSRSPKKFVPKTPTVFRCKALSDSFFDAKYTVKGYLQGNS